MDDTALRRGDRPVGRGRHLDNARHDGGGDTVCNGESDGGDGGLRGRRGEQRVARSVAVSQRHLPP